MKRTADWSVKEKRAGLLFPSLPDYSSWPKIKRTGDMKKKTLSFSALGCVASASSGSSDTAVLLL